MEIETRLDIAVLTLKSVVQASSLEIQARFIICSLEAQLLLYLETSIFAPKTFN